MSELKLLLICEDTNSISQIIKSISETYPELKLSLAKNGKESWTMIQNQNPNIVLIDNRISGYNLEQLVRLIKDEKYETNSIYTIILIDSSSELNSFVSNGNIVIDDFIIKSNLPLELSIKTKNAIKVVSINSELYDTKNLLYQLAKRFDIQSKDLINLAVKLIDARIPNSIETVHKIATASVWIAKSYNKFSDEQIKNIEIASYLSQAGKIYLGDKLVNLPVMNSGRPTDELMYTVPKLSRDLISIVSTFEEVSKIVYSIYENFDGTGIPEQSQSWQIPFESRIIRVASDYEELKIYHRKSARQAIEIIKSEGKRLYDERVIILMEQYIKSYEISEKIENEKAVNLTELKENMTTTRAIYTELGQKLLPPETKLSEKIIQRIISHNTTDPILGRIYVKRF